MSATGRERQDASFATLQQVYFRHDKDKFLTEHELLKQKEFETLKSRTGV